MTYDQKSYDLAAYFLPDGTDAAKHELAQDIQRAIEDFLSSQSDN